MECSHANVYVDQQEKGGGGGGRYGVQKFGRGPKLCTKRVAPGTHPICVPMSRRLSTGRATAKRAPAFAPNNDDDDIFVEIGVDPLEAPESANTSAGADEQSQSPSLETMGEGLVPPFSGTTVAFDGNDFDMDMDMDMDITQRIIDRSTRCCEDVRGTLEAAGFASKHDAALINATDRTWPPDVEFSNRLPLFQCTLCNLLILTEPITPRVKVLYWLMVIEAACPERFVSSQTPAILRAGGIQRHKCYAFTSNTALMAMLFGQAGCVLCDRCSRSLCDNLRLAYKDFAAAYGFQCATNPLKPGSLRSGNTVLTDTAYLANVPTTARSLAAACTLINGMPATTRELQARFQEALRAHVAVVASWTPGSLRCSPNATALLTQARETTATAEALHALLQRVTGIVGVGGSTIQKSTTKSLPVRRSRKRHCPEALPIADAFTASTALVTATGTVIDTTPSIAHFSTAMDAIAQAACLQLGVTTLSGSEQLAKDFIFAAFTNACDPTNLGSMISLDVYQALRTAADATVDACIHRASEVPTLPQFDMSQLDGCLTQGVTLDTWTTDATGFDVAKYTFTSTPTPVDTCPLLRPISSAMEPRAANGLVFTCNGFVRSAVAHRVVIGDIAALSILHGNDEVADQIIVFPQDEKDGHNLFHRATCILFTYDDGAYTVTSLQRKAHTKVELVTGMDAFAHGLSKPTEFTLLIDDKLETKFAVTMVSPPCAKRLIAV